MHIVSEEDNLHEMSNPILETICLKFQILFSGKNKKKYFKMPSAKLLPIMLSVNDTTLYRKCLKAVHFSIKKNKKTFFLLYVKIPFQCELLLKKRISTARFDACLLTSPLSRYF